MEKFMLTLTKGNDRTVLAICETKEEALAKGNELYPNLLVSSGTLSVIYGETDCKKYRLFHSWI